MPCSDRGEQLDWNLRHYGMEVEDRDVAMKVACAALTFIEESGHLVMMPKYVQKWWENHKRWDRASSN